MVTSWRSYSWCNAVWKNCSNIVFTQWYVQLCKSFFFREGKVALHFCTANKNCSLCGHRMQMRDLQAFNYSQQSFMLYYCPKWLTQQSVHNLLLDIPTALDQVIPHLICLSWALENPSTNNIVGILWNTRLLQWRLQKIAVLPKNAAPTPLLCWTCKTCKM